MSSQPLRVGHDDASPRNLAPRFIAFGIAIVLAVTGLGLRLFQLQVAEGASFDVYATKQLTTERPIPVSRGLMYDRKNRLLVENVPTFVLRILPAELPYEERPAVAARISELTGVKTRQIIERIDAHTGSQYDPVRITDIKTRVARAIAEDSESVPGCPDRPRGAAQVLGRRAHVACARVDRPYQRQRVSAAQG